MSDDQTPLDQIPPLGKSVEDVEADNTNRVNPAMPGEDREGGTDSDPFIAPTGLGGSGVTGTGVGVPFLPTASEPTGTAQQDGRDDTDDNEQG